MYALSPHEVKEGSGGDLATVVTIITIIKGIIEIINALGKMVPVEASCEVTKTITTNADGTTSETESQGEWYWDEPSDPYGA